MKPDQIEEFLTHIENPRIEAVLTIQTALLREMGNFAVKRGFVQLMPILTSPFTDPLNHDVYPAEISYGEQRLKLTASMIFHKQLALVSPSLRRIFIVSPNIRLERMEAMSSENHLVEFSQFDFEIKDADMNEAMSFVEQMLAHLFGELERQCGEELERLGRALPAVRPPLLRYRSEELRARRGPDYYRWISEQAEAPFFVTSFPREFYDREDAEHPGTFRNFDLVYPEGYGEAASGAERENEYERIIHRMRERGTELEAYSSYLAVARRGLLPRSAGGGIGIERLLRFACGRPRINEVGVFDRSVSSAFIF